MQLISNISKDRCERKCVNNYQYGGDIQKCIYLFICFPVCLHNKGKEKGQS